MKVKALKNRKGITLTELIISLAIFVIIAGVASMFIVQGFQFYKVELNTNSDEGTLRNAMSGIVRSMHAATGTVSAASNVLTVGSDVYSLSGHNLMKNGAVYLAGVSAFTAAQSGDVVSITIKTDGGRSLSASYGKRG